MPDSRKYIPPMFINLFPRKRVAEYMKDNLPPGSIVEANPTGWINEELFTSWLKHFLRTVQPKARPEPVLLLADGHTSHTRNLDVIQLAKDNNAIMLIFPSHCTHRLQPCDVSLFKSLNWHYDDRCAKKQQKSNRANPDDVRCLYCDALFSESRSRESWIECEGECYGWAHTSCAWVTKKEVQFVSELCND
jgi:hypothetical protein